MSKTITIAILSLSLTAVPSLAQRNPAFTVLSTGDGDTLRVRDGQQTITVRMACIDAPETAQRPWGQQSARRLRELLPPGRAVRVREVEKDRYGRTVAEVFVANESVNLRMVKEGHAVVYRQYLNGCANREQYIQAEAEAKRRRLGFWNQNNPVMPWEYRRSRRRG